MAKKPKQRHFVTSVNPDGSEDRAGSQSGYESSRKAWEVAEKLAAKSGQTHCVTLKEECLDSPGEWEVVETEGYTDGQETST